MGKGTILSEIGEGLYRVEVDYGEDILQDRLSALNSTLARLEAETSALESRLSDAESAASSTSGALNSAINAYSAAIIAGGDAGAAKAELNRVLAIHNQSLLRAQLARTKLSGNTAALANTEARIDYLQGFNLIKEMDAWCADYTLEAEGEVATIEVPGEPMLTLIVPGGEEGEIPVPTGADGRVVARAAQTPEQLYFNLALLPGWQKEKPTYRLGEITEVDYGTDECGVDLDAATSSAQALNINKVNSLSGIPIEYMDCHAAIFETGDRVVVKFDGQSWDGGKVIGFESNPKPCWGLTLKTWQRDSEGYNIFYGTPKRAEEELRGYFESAIIDRPENFYPITEIEIFAKRGGEGSPWHLLNRQRNLDARHTSSGPPDYPSYAISFSHSAEYSGARELYECLLVRRHLSSFNGGVLWMDLAFAAGGGGGDLGNIDGVIEWYMRRTTGEKKAIFHFAVDYIAASAYGCVTKEVSGFYTNNSGTSPLIGFSVSDLDYELSLPPP